MATANAEVRKLIKDFGKLPPALRKELRPALRKGSQPALAEAKRRAGWSSRIPAATRISTSFAKKRAGVSIRVSAKRAPHARPNEDLDGSGDFRHPVFGNRSVWVTQHARPFLVDALHAKGHEVTTALAEMVVQIGRKHGWNR